jgi:hypothetical protein
MKSGPGGYGLGAALWRHIRGGNVELLIFLLVVFLIALVAGFGWRAGTRRRL